MFPLVRERSVLNPCSPRSLCPQKQTPTNPPKPPQHPEKMTVSPLFFSQMWIKTFLSCWCVFSFFINSQSKKSFTTLVIFIVVPPPPGFTRYFDRAFYFPPLPCDGTRDCLFFLPPPVGSSETTGSRNDPPRFYLNLTAAEFGVVPHLFKRQKNPLR